MKIEGPLAEHGEFDLDFRKVFVLALLAGILAIGYGQLKDDVLASVVSPLLVMVVYLAVGIRHAESGDRIEQFADSLYYLGFLFTLIALCASLLAYQTAEVKFNLLVANFALALVTTIFGLAARIVIVHFRNPPTDRNTLEDILEHQTAKLCRAAGRISRELESASREIAEWHKARIEEHSLRIETALKSIDTLSEKAARSIGDVTETAATSVAETLDGLRGRLESAHFPEELFAEKLAPSIARFADQLNAGGDLLGEFMSRQIAMQDSMRAAAESFQGFEQEIGGLKHAVNGFREELDIDRGARGKLVELAQNMSGILASSTSLTRELHAQTENSRKIANILGEITEQMNRIPAQVDVTASAVRESTRTLIKSSTVLASHSGTVRESLEQFARDLSGLQQRFSGLDVLSGRIGQTSESLGLLIESLRSSFENLSGLEESHRDQLEMIGRHQQELRRILAESRAGLEGITSHFVRAVEYVTEKLRA
jgi:hypothetical protein